MISPRSTPCPRCRGLDDARWRSLLDHRDDARWRSLLDHPGDACRGDARWRSLLDHRRGVRA